jgi:hypothetical protein
VQHGRAGEVSAGAKTGGLAAVCEGSPSVASNPCALALSLSASTAWSQPAPSGGPYRVVTTVKAGGEGGFDYLYAHAGGRRLYIPRIGPAARIMVLVLDTLEAVGEIAKTLTLDPKTGRLFLIAVEFGPPPPPAPDAAPAPAGRPQRGPMIPGSFSVLVVGR